MLDEISLDHLEVFIACARAGSFSAAARALNRTQSMISHAIARFESHLGVALFERHGRVPTLTAEGRALLADARIVSKTMDGFRARARSLAQGSEREVSIALTALFPPQRLLRAVGRFRDESSQLGLQLRVEAPEDAMRLVLERSCGIGIVGWRPGIPEELEVRPLFEVPTVTVVARHHPLAREPGPIPRAVLAQSVQIACEGWPAALDERSALPPVVWKLTDLGMKHAFLRAGFGWGTVPLPMVGEELAQGLLVKIEAEDAEPRTTQIELVSIHRRDSLPGPACGRLLRHLAAD